MIVADQDMLYENKWARIAWLTGIDNPPKKKKLWDTGVRKQSSDGCDKHGSNAKGAYKKGIHVRFSKNPRHCKTM